MRLRDASFGYDARDIFGSAELELSPGDKVAIVGANGAGKTTLLRLLAGQLEPRTGSREVMPHTRLAYFAQHAAETLDHEATVLGALEAAAPPPWRPRLRNLLGSFLFSGDDVYKLCRILSGGERQRVALARILMEPANLLLLDEPTHHLDLAGKEVLEEALAQFPGAVVVVTHDRSLMARLATRVLEVAEARIVPYPGGYEDYEAARLSRVVVESDAGPSRPSGPAQGQPRRAPAATSERNPRAASRGAGTDRSGSPTSPLPGHRAARVEQQRRDKEIQRIEKDIDARDRRLKDLETRLADPEIYQDGARAKELIGEYERLRAEMESLWQRLAEL